MGSALIVWGPGSLHTVTLPWVLSLLGKPFLRAVTTVEGERTWNRLR